MAAACEQEAACFSYALANRRRSVKRLRKWPGVQQATEQMGYEDVEAYLGDAWGHYEAVYALSTFCLSPPGDTFTRRGFWDALLVGCIPVVFDDRSRHWPTFFESGGAQAVSALIPVAQFAANTSALGDTLRSMLPLVPAMREAIAQQATGFQWAFSDLDEQDHAAVGPDALDLALYRLATIAKAV